jgi:hypothetical protein
MRVKKFSATDQEYLPADERKIQGLLDMVVRIDRFPKAGDSEVLWVTIPNDLDQSAVRELMTKELRRPYVWLGSWPIPREGTRVVDYYLPDTQGRCDDYSTIEDGEQ